MELKKKKIPKTLISASYNLNIFHSFGVSKGFILVIFEIVHKQYFLVTTIVHYNFTFRVISVNAGYLQLKA